MVDGPWTEVLERLRSMPSRNPRVGVITSPDIVTRQAMLGAICEYAPQYHFMAQVGGGKPEPMSVAALGRGQERLAGPDPADQVLLILPSADDLSDSQVAERLRVLGLSDDPEIPERPILLFIGEPQFALKARMLAPQGVRIEHWSVGGG